MAREVIVAANAVVGEPTLPDFSAAKSQPEGVRISAFDQLNGSLYRNALCGSQKQVDMLWHHNEFLELIFSRPPVCIKCLQKETNIVLDNEQFSPLPSLKGHEVRSGRRNASRGLHRSG